jgi:hypothetical protein
MTVYYDANQIEPGHFPAMLAIGDSWFWYPFASNLLAELSAAVKPALEHPDAGRCATLQAGDRQIGGVRARATPNNAQFYRRC